MYIFFLIFLGKLTAFFSKLLNKGSGSTWPGHIALSLNKNFIKDILKNSQIEIVLVAGTNGKTTTGKMIAGILQRNGKKVIHNTTGANLLNGVASTLLLNSNLAGKTEADFGIFEIDENSLPLVFKEVSPVAVICLNLFRDQLDRYGELDSIARKWKKAFSGLTHKTTLILNADDPQVAFLGQNLNKNINVVYFGLNEKGIKKIQQVADSIYCPKCGNKLSFDTVYYSHLGHWHCEKCKLSRPNPSLSTFFSPLMGMYNLYNSLAAALFAKYFGIKDEKIKEALQNVAPAFGRQEKLNIEGKKVQIFLSKNPASFNQSLQTIREIAGYHQPGKINILFVLNDRIPDGRDVSWIWDIDLEEYVKEFENIIISGDRVYDMALRLQYAEKTQNFNSKIKAYESLKEAVSQGLNKVEENETLYILPTYSAMLEVRKILTGRKIL